jgi:hypothetical protein
MTLSKHGIHYIVHDQAIGKYNITTTQEGT